MGQRRSTGAERECPPLPGDAGRMTFPLERGDRGASERVAPGGPMLRVTAWTVGLFGAGAALAHAVPGPWAEPLVLVALGLAFLLVSARTGVRPARPVTQLPA